MIFKLKTSAAMPALNLPTGKKPAATTASNGQLTGLAKSIVDKEQKSVAQSAVERFSGAPKMVDKQPIVDAPKVDASANKNDASLALGKLNPDIKAQEMGGSGLGDLTSSTSPAKQRIDTENNSSISSKMLGKLETSPRPGISDVISNANLPTDASVVQPPKPEKIDAGVATGMIPVVPPAAPAEQQRSETNTESDIKEAPPTTDIGLQEVPTGPGNTGLDTGFESTIGIARTALDKMLNENADPALRAEAEAALREAEAAGVKDTRKSQALGATGLSGAGGRLESDVRKLGKRETVTAMDEYDRTARQEETKRLQEGLGLSGDIQRAELERLAVERARRQLGTVKESTTGDITETAPDGSTRITKPNGDVITRRNNGTVTTHPDGTQTIVMDEAFVSDSPITVKSDGYPDVSAPVRGERGNGQITENAPTYTDASGNKYKTYRDPDGTVFLVQQ